MVKLGTPITKITVAHKASGKRMNINEVDYDPDVFVLWDDFAAAKEEETGKPTLSKRSVETEIMAADNLGAVAMVASKYKLKLPGNIKNVKTAKTKLLAQLEG